MKKLKILHIQETIGSGGVERLRLSLAKHLDKNLFDQIFVCTNAVGNIPDEIRAEGFEVVPIGRLKSPFDWKQHKKVQKIIEEYQPDIIHGAVFEGVTMAAINGWMKKVPVIIIEETSDPQNRSWKGDMLMKVFSRLANKVIGVSEGVTEEYLKGKLNLLSSKAITINNGVAIPRSISEDELSVARMQYGISESDFVIGSMGRMLQDSHKRFSDLIKGFAVFSENKINAKLLLVGGGPEVAGYRTLVNSLGIEEKVIFAGYQSDVTLYYKLMNVFALVSAREAFGLVLAEAMLNKLPVLATRVGGMKYIVEDQQTGFLIEPFQIDQIAKKLNYFYQHLDERVQMGKNGYEKAVNNYIEEIYINNIKKLYVQSYYKE